MCLSLSIHWFNSYTFIAIVYPVRRGLRMAIVSQRPGGDPTLYHRSEKPQCHSTVVEIHTFSRSSVNPLFGVGGWCEHLNAMCVCVFLRCCFSYVKGNPPAIAAYHLSLNAKIWHACRLTNLFFSGSLWSLPISLFISVLAPTWCGHFPSNVGHPPKNRERALRYFTAGWAQAVVLWTLLV